MFEHNLSSLASHFVEILTRDAPIIQTSQNETVFKKVVYGEPRVIADWPLCSVQPLSKERELKTTHKFAIEFVIEIFVYHGKVGPILEVQEEVHRKAEALEDYLDKDRRWNFVDKEDKSKDKVIWGHSVMLDHPIVILGTDELWSASRLRMQGLSEEVWRDA